MAPHVPPSNDASHNTGYRVEAPRRNDAVGVVLRNAYERDLGIPEDMAMMLCRLNGKTSVNH